MITVSFVDGTQTITSEVSQYDFGQRVRLYGLPSPEDFEQYDDFIAGQTDILLEVHYYLNNDDQAICYLAQWNDDESCWEVDAPDELLEQCNPINMAIYVKFSELIRAKTYYRASFTPAHRASPSDRATQIQIKTWVEMQEEFDLIITRLGTAISHANQQKAEMITATDNCIIQTARASAAADTALTAAAGADASSLRADTATSATVAAINQAQAATTAANTATSNANAAKDNANAAAAAANTAASSANTNASKIATASVRSVTTLPTKTSDGSAADATATATVTANGLEFTFGIPQGIQGIQGPTGPQGVPGPAGVTFVRDGTALYITLTNS